jgi:hypothetical protein
MTSSSTTERRATGPAPAGRTPPVWLAVVAGIALGGVVFGLLDYAVGRTATPDAASMEALSEQLTAEHEAEHRRMTEELTAASVEVYDDLLPLLAALNDAMPVLEPGAGEPATEAQVDAWRTTTDDAEERLHDFGLGEPTFNATHGTLLGAVRQLDSAVLTYQEAIAAQEPAQSRLLELSATQRDHATEMWGVAAEQLDELNIHAGIGHVHLFLPADGDQASIPEEFHSHESS